jgi:hypothetical protein
MYGLRSKAEAEEQASKLNEKWPDNAYYVEQHSGFREYHPQVQPTTWGVVRWVPYYKDGSRRCDGFVWFPRGRSIA